MNATQAIDNIIKLLGLQFKKETFNSTFLADGTEVTNNADGEFEVGQTLYIVKESTLAPAPEGSHETREGLVLTVDSESTIIAIASKNTESTDVNSTPEKMTVAEDAQGQKLESPTFDVGEDVYVISEDGSKSPAPDGEHQVVLKDESGNENKIRIMVMDGKITERENVEEAPESESGEEEMAAYPWSKCIQDQLDAGYDEETAKKICGKIKAENMSEEFARELNDIKVSLSELLNVVNSMNGKFKTELGSLKTEFDNFKKAPERKSVDEKKTFTETFSDYKLELIKNSRR